MINFKNITHKIVLGTVQLGLDYGVTNLKGIPKKKEVFKIFEFAWENGVRRFDTAPAYKTEALLGEFISVNKIENEILILTKVPSLDNSTNYKDLIISSLKKSQEKLCCPIEVLFFHNPSDSHLLLDDSNLFKDLINEFEVNTLGVSVYEPWEVNKLLGCNLNLAFQFPFNALDKRFENIKMQKGFRYARSVFLQGLLASRKQLKSGVPLELFKLQKLYHSKLVELNLSPIKYALSFVYHNPTVDYFLLGVASINQLKQLIDIDLYSQRDFDMLSGIKFETNEYWIDPRNWRIK